MAADFKHIYEEIKKASSDIKGKQRPLVRMVDIIRDKAGSYGNRYKSVLGSISKVMTQRKVQLPGQDEEAQRTALGEILAKIADGDRPRHAAAIVEWLYYNRRGELDNLLDSIEYQWPESADMPIRYHAFLCWSGPYAQAICEAIKDFFEGLEAPINVFLSSRDIENASQWRGVLHDSLTTSARGLLIATQDIIDSPYAAYEYGMLSAQSEDRVPTVLLLDAPSVVLPKPFHTRQFQKFSEESLLRWVRQVIEEEGGKTPADAMENLRTDLRKVVEDFTQMYVTPDEQRWQISYSRPLLMADQNSSPYDLEQLLRIVQKNLILVAQNHYFMIVSDNDGHERFWPAVRKALLRGVKIEIVAMHRDVTPSTHGESPVPDASRVWGIYNKAEDSYADQEEKCWRVLAHWHALREELAMEHSGVGELIIYGAYFAPVTMSFVDPYDDERGLGVLSLRVSDDNSESRPHLILRRKYETAPFKYYLSTLRKNVGSREWRRMFVEEKAT